jgi:hypothetical protein
MSAENAGRIGTKLLMWVPGTRIAQTFGVLGAYHNPKCPHKLILLRKIPFWAPNLQRQGLQILERRPDRIEYDGSNLAKRYISSSVERKVT